MSAIHKLLTDHIDIWTAAESEKKSGRGRSAGNAVSVYGIKKLRELILELAVRGKLVPQDPNDEPASELLKRIADKKASIARDMGRAPKALAQIPGEEMSFELPDGWSYSRFGDVVNVSTGKLDANAAVDGGQYPFFTCSQTPSSIDSFSYETEAVLLAGNGDFNIKFYSGRFDAYQRTYVLEPVMWDLKFCFYLVSARISEFTKNNRGSAVKYLKLGDITDPVFLIPPLAEQQRIVAKVDELMALCDQLETQHNNAAEAHEKLVSHLLGTLTQSQSAEDFSDNWQRIAAHFDTLFTTEASIDALKQTLLQLAVMGKLVPQDPNEEPASKLVRRKTLISSENVPFLIPDNWIWACVDELAETRLGKMLDNAKNKGTPLRYLRNINVRWFDFDLSDVKEMRFEDSELEEFSLECGDVLVCEGGYPGRAAVWDEREDNIYFQKALHRVRLQEKVNPYYFVKVLRESADSGRLATYFTGAGIQHFTGKGLKTFLVPLPPFEEQNRVVAKVDELMVLCDQLKSRLTDANQLQQKLADVMVEQAVA